MKLGYILVGTRHGSKGSEIITSLFRDPSIMAPIVCTFALPPIQTQATSLIPSRSPSTQGPTVHLFHDVVIRGISTNQSAIHSHPFELVHYPTVRFNKEISS